MPWEKIETKITSHYEFLRNTAGRFIGFIVKFNDECYAWTDEKQIGKYSTIGEAKDAVENYLER